MTPFAVLVGVLSFPLSFVFIVVRAAWQTAIWFEKGAHRWCDEREKGGAP